MNRWFLAFTAAAIVGTAAIPNKAEAQVYVYEGARYCFYPDGWQGPGWYRCGYRWRQGLGWGGGYDWGLSFGWRNHGWEKRRHVHDGRRFRGQTQQSGAPIIRGGATVQQPTTTGRGSISRGSSPEIQSGTTGVGPSRSGSDMRGGGQGGMTVAPSGGGQGGVNVGPGGGQGGGATGGGMSGGNVGGGSAGGGGGGQQKR